MTKSTLQALLARGLDSRTAENLIAKKYTIQKLKLLPKNKLFGLGLSEDFINILFKESRPPIPLETLIKVLHESKRTCCICRDPQKSVVVHHIHEWSKSRNHGETNLVVLCLDHHNEAHTKRDLALSLTPDFLKSSKEKWIKIVSLQDSKNSLILKNSHNYARWDYINYRRYTEIISNMYIEFEPNKMLDELISNNQLDKNYLIPNIDTRRTLLNYSYFLNDGEGFKIASIISEILKEIISRIPFIDITDYILSKSTLFSIINQHDFIFFQGNFFFKPIEDNKLHKAYYRAHQIRIEFTFDPFYCFSSSSRYDTMTGHSVINAYMQVINIEKDEDDILHIKASCLFIGSHFQEHSARLRRLEKLSDIDED
ncbi:TPA: HNH endonuclease [Acinetobacter baumannii]|uniref:HNH endonuclease n=1 Tax=Acinetobacter baumannii TaxID=470 RepID=UPI001FD71CEB|nr:HNH endonuclease signature motif containing protein [Acinetobacter baumannii]EKV4525493.1 HNH endonuclease [Acinetobacter baumannii]MDC5063591.1 HNH endonuclease [Acinetobacter baumannii]HDF7034784.1 HNH endonuclease [Acinetobacter baumannii]